MLKRQITNGQSNLKIILPQNSVQREKQMENTNEEANAKVQHMPKRGPEREEERMEKTWYLRMAEGFPELRKHRAPDLKIRFLKVYG